MNSVGFWQGGVLQAFVAVGADGSEVAEGFVAAFGFVDDVADGQSHGSVAAERVGIARGNAAHLAGIAISLQHLCAKFLRDLTSERWYAINGFQKIFTGSSQIVPLETL